MSGTGDAGRGGSAQHDAAFRVVLLVDDSDTMPLRMPGGVSQLGRGKLLRIHGTTCVPPLPVRLLPVRRAARVCVVNGVWRVVRGVIVDVSRLPVFPAMGAAMTGRCTHVHACRIPRNLAELDVDEATGTVQLTAVRVRASCRASAWQPW